MVTCLKNVETFDYVLMESFRRRSDALQIKEGKRKMIFLAHMWIEVYPCMADV